MFPVTKRPNSRIHISRHSPAAGIEIATPTIKNPAEGVSKQVLGKKHRGVKKRAGADANVKWLFATESLANEPEAEQVAPLVAPTDISATAGAGVEPTPAPRPLFSSNSFCKKKKLNLSRMLGLYQRVRGLQAKSA